MITTSSFEMHGLAEMIMEQSLSLNKWSKRVTFWTVDSPAMRAECNIKLYIKELKVKQSS